MNKRVPVLLVTGFLGSGKTTFINWLLRTHPDLNISLILNEFGDIKLESQFVKERAEGIIELKNGCMCCVAKSDVPRVVRYILDNSPKTDYMVVEASGLSDPEPVRSSLQSPELEERIRLDIVLCIVDCMNFSETSGKYPIVLSQVGDADVVILTKTEPAGEDSVTAIMSRLENMSASIRTLEFTEDLNPKLFLTGDMRRELANSDSAAEKPRQSHAPHIHEPIQEYWFISDKDIAPEKLQEVLTTLPTGIIRGKGFVRSAGKKYLVQYVCGKYEIEEGAWERSEKPQSVLLFLGQEFNPAEIDAKLQACISG